jgi:hypothetical protein
LKQENQCQLNFEENQMKRISYVNEPSIHKGMLFDLEISQ